MSMKSTLIKDIRKPLQQEQVVPKTEEDVTVQEVLSEIERENNIDVSKPIYQELIVQSNNDMSNQLLQQQLLQQQLLQQQLLNQQNINKNSFVINFPILIGILVILSFFYGCQLTIILSKIQQFCLRQWMNFILEINTLCI